MGHVMWGWWLPEILATNPLAIALLELLLTIIVMVINQKFFPSAFSDDRIFKLLALVRAYFKKGGQELQINATSRDVLLDALAHPENYQNLVVRVSGFSDYFVRLDKDVQLDILNRTQQGD